jgi:hypothetical protein
MIPTYEFQTWVEFKANVFKELFKDTTIQRGKYLFRGQKLPEWKLASTFDRSFPSIVDDNKRDEIELALLKHFKKECEDDSSLKNLVENDDEALKALAQHYGVPTRLLDWTESPYVAAFFAFQHAISVYNKTIADFNPENKIAIWALDSESSIWKRTHGVTIMCPKTWDNDRMRNQYGKFTLNQTPHHCLEKYVEQFSNATNALICFHIPHSQAHVALADLDLMGINNSSMYADLSGKALTAISKTVLEAKV